MPLVFVIISAIIRYVNVKDMTMKKFYVLFLVVIFTSCSTTVTSPVTQFEYTGHIKEEGFGVMVKPPFWQSAVDFYKYCTE